MSNGRTQTTKRRHEQSGWTRGYARAEDGHSGETPAPKLEWPEFPHGGTALAPEMSAEGTHDFP